MLLQQSYFDLSLEEIARSTPDLQYSVEDSWTDRQGGLLQYKQAAVLVLCLGYSGDLNTGTSGAFTHFLMSFKSINVYVALFLFLKYLMQVSVLNLDSSPLAFHCPGLCHRISIPFSVGVCSAWRASRSALRNLEAERLWYTLCVCIFVVFSVVPGAPGMDMSAVE